MKKIAIIGGSGLEDPAILKEVTEVDVKTPTVLLRRRLNVAKLVGWTWPFYQGMAAITLFHLRR